MNRMTLALGLGFLAGVAMPAGKASAASFDCSRARGTDEVAVCRNAGLSALDSEMGGLWYAYSRLPMLMGENGNRRQEAADFLTRRHACGANAGCLTRLYRARIAALRSGLDASLASYSHMVLGTPE